MSDNAIVKRYTLTGGENTFSSPAAVNESDARKLQSLIPSLSGAYERERPALPFTNDAAFASRVGFFHEFKRNDNGVVTYHYFCATATTLYKLTNPGVGQTWAVVTVPQPVSFPNSGPNGGNIVIIGPFDSGGFAPLVLNGFPVAVNINNQMHLSDGVNSYIFDGTNWVKDGLEIPTHPPSIVGIFPAASSQTITSITRSNGIVTVNFTLSGSTPAGGYFKVSGVTNSTFNGTFFISTFVVGGGGAVTVTYPQPGFPDVSSSGGTFQFANFSVTANRYYWTTFADQSARHPHESSSSPISVGTGAFSNSSVTLKQRACTSYGTSGTNVTGNGTDFNTSDIGLGFFGFNAVGDALVLLGTIVSVADSQHLTLNADPGFSSTGAAFVIAPLRATHWYVYASSSEEDKEGNLLATIQITGTYNITGVLRGPLYTDQSPFIGVVGSYFQGVNRPLLNDPPHATKIMEVHKNRIWRRLPTFPNFFSYSGYEEILAEQAGTPSETIPGADNLHTVSPGQVNETSYPDQSAFITNLQKHGDALYIGTEKNAIPLYGSGLADFQLSEAQAFAVGFAGRRASCSTPFGLAFLSYDLKVYLYPSQYSFGVDSTTALVELGRPKRPEFEQIDGTDLENVFMVFYNWGRRNWLVLSYRRTDQTFASWVFDFETKAWFQLQQGYTAITVFEMTPGRKSLIAAAPDNKTYVIDDLTGNFPVPPGTNYPVGYFRALLDFADPDSAFIIQSVGYEKSNIDMGVDVTMWLDPVDPENPGTGIPLGMVQTKLGANSFIGRPNPTTGGSCQRVLVEYAIASSPIAGRFHGFTVEAEKTHDPVL